MDRTYEINIDGYESFYCRDDTTIMHTMCENRTGPKHYGCCGGGCGICKMKIVSGEYEIISRMSREHVSMKEETLGIVLLCCIQPRSIIKIKTIN